MKWVKLWRRGDEYMMSTWWCMMRWWVHEVMMHMRWGHDWNDTNWGYEVMRSLAKILIFWNHINEDVNSKYRMSSPWTSICLVNDVLANILISWNHMRWGYETWRVPTCTSEKKFLANILIEWNHMKWGCTWVPTWRAPTHYLWVNPERCWGSYKRILECPSRIRDVMRKSYRGTR